MGTVRGGLMLPAVPSAGTPVTAADIQRIESIVAECVRAVEDIEELQTWRDQAAALEAYLRSKQLQRPMLGAQRRIEARIGELLGEAPGHGPGRGKKNTHAEGLSRDGDRSDFRILARGFGCLDEDEWRKSRRALVSLLRHRLHMLPETPPLPEGKFRCIVADPPWQLDTGPNVFGGTGESGHDNLEYEQLSVDDIKQLPVEKSAADDAHLYLWTTNKYLEASYSVARAWGFKPSVILVWAKTPRGVGLGDAFKLTTEFCLYARRGSLKERMVVERTWFEWARRRHSEKPEAFYEMVESVAHAPFLEMFSRRNRDGWTHWGEEA
jgi:N6-adenosine-specific RNA methylase IME4